MIFTPFEIDESLIRSHRDRPEDEADLRLYRRVENLGAEDWPKFKESDFVLLGYPDDRGIERNGGRTGACEAPNEIRKILYKMTPSPMKSKDFKIWDGGNLRSWSMDLLDAHERARSVISALRAKEVKIITLGGGHDWAYPDFVDWNGSILHLDAHLDMRPNPESKDRAGHSGTPFRRILTTAKKAPQINVIGLQSHCNARAHLDWAGAFPVSALFLEELPNSFDAQWELIVNQTNLSESNLNFAMSIDMDVFAQSISPGVSAPQALGLDPQHAIKLIQHLGPRLSHLGIYEASPRYDRDSATARLAAKFIHEFLMSG